MYAGNLGLGDQVYAWLNAGRSPLSLGSQSTCEDADDSVELCSWVKDNGICEEGLETAATKCRKTCGWCLVDNGLLLIYMLI